MKVVKSSTLIKNNISFMYMQYYTHVQGVDIKRWYNYLDDPLPLETIDLQKVRQDFLLV